MRPIFALCLLLAAAPALRAQVVVPPEVQDDDDDAQAVGGAGTQMGKADSLPGAGRSKSDSHVSEGSAAPKAAAGASAGAVGSGVRQPNGAAGSSATPVKITKVLPYDNIPAMPEHQLAHGVVRLSASGLVWSVGMTAYSTDVLQKAHASALTGGCRISMSPRAFSDQGCQLWVWISEKPGGAPLSHQCLWAENTIITDATNVGGGWYTAMPGSKNPDLGYLCEVPKNGQRYYCNISAGGFDGPLAPKKCDAMLNFPMGSMPQDVYPDSFPR